MTTAGRMTALAAPQWRISDDRVTAAKIAADCGADELQLDFGGAHRGPRLDQRDELTAAARLSEIIPISTLAVNHANDIGLVSKDGSPNSASIRLLRAALRCATELGVTVLHIPGFRRSAPDTAARIAGTAAVLETIGDEAATRGVEVAYESALDGRASVALAQAAGDRLPHIVFDLGNLLDAGHSPDEFIAEVGDRLHRCVHVKWHDIVPAADCLATMRIPSNVDAILVENDYRDGTARLVSDLDAVRAHASKHEGAV